MEGNKWAVKAEYENKLTLADVKFILEQAEKHLKETTAVSTLIVSRATTLITISAGLLSGLVGYSINRWQSNQQMDALLITAILSIGYLFWVIYTLYVNIKGQDYCEVGSEPKSLVADSFFDPYFDSTDEITRKEKDEERTREFYLCEINSYQERIECNKRINKVRWVKFNRSLWCIIYTPLFLAITYFLISLTLAFIDSVS